MTQALVSVIMPTYNSAQWLAESIDCVLNQTYKNLELIITDEEAMDTSRELALKEGLGVGISSGTNVACAIRLAKRLGKGKTVLTVLPDSYDRYYSTPLFSK